MIGIITTLAVVIWQVVLRIWMPAGSICKHTSIYFLCALHFLNFIIFLNIIILSTQCAAALTCNCSFYICIPIVHPRWCFLNIFGAKKDKKSLNLTENSTCLRFSHGCFLYLSRPVCRILKGMLKWNKTIFDVRYPLHYWNNKIQYYYNGAMFLYICVQTPPRGIGRSPLHLLWGSRGSMLSMFFNWLLWPKEGWGFFFKFLWGEVLHKYWVQSTTNHIYVNTF